MNASSSLKIAKRFGIASVSLFAAGLLFRFAVYRHMYIAPDAPYGRACTPTLTITMLVGVPSGHD